MVVTSLVFKSRDGVSIVAGVWTSTDEFVYKLQAYLRCDAPALSAHIPLVRAGSVNYKRVGSR